MTVSITKVRRLVEARFPSPHEREALAPRYSRGDSVHDDKLSCRVGGWHSRDDYYESASAAKLTFGSKADVWQRS